MTTATLTDRYVDAAMRTVPEAQRDDLAAELRGSIDDQIEARLAEGQDHTSAERAVLTDLGDPDKLAAQYTDRPLWLVGPRYFLDWWRLLKLLLWIVPVCAAFGVSLAMVLNGATFGEIVGAIVPLLISVVVHIAFWTTLVFVVLERSGHETMTSGPWTPDQLPEPRQRGAGLGDMVASLAFLAIMAGVVLWDHFVGLVPTQPGLPFLDPGLWPWWIIGLFVLMALEAVLAVVVYAVGRWTPALAVANGILNLIVAVPALWLLFEGRLINPEFFPSIIADDGAKVGVIVNVVFGFVIAGIAIWDTVDAAMKAARARRG
ncbi:permease prefix domain 1-containing protein [Microbacterium sp. QXD-8]|uniref:Permease prefix domain 1-containing protein n=1 Tax=Microbacterium psychrotolerans TaxID=3068321 RepID=A0ABU0Z4H7_9MICO|nr:permease prefix domain 1-containing protein [Microbacterium sp. QXD-8]MDQ7879487.1 permease prefix domain 1-containing protein [Microbacterium sp. QXD-8]